MGDKKSFHHLTTNYNTKIALHPSFWRGAAPQSAPDMILTRFRPHSDLKRVIFQAQTRSNRSKSGPNQAWQRGSEGSEPEGWVRLGGGPVAPPESLCSGRPIFIQCRYWEEMRSLYGGAEHQPSTGQKSHIHGSRNFFQYWRSGLEKGS